MAVLFTYPLKSTLSPNDLALISNSEDGNKTNNATMTSIKDVIDVVDSITATSPIVASSLTGGVNISSKPYSGGNNLGHVPSGGTVDTFLRGDGSWGSSPIPLASITTRGGVKIDPNPMSGKNYPVLLSNERAYVNVPWTNTTYTTATSGTLGLVKIGYTESGKNYPVELLNDQMFVNVPWTDTGTTYSASTGLTLTGTVFSANTVGTQSNLANNASSVAGRSYPIQTGAASGTVGSDHLIVNIPWTDTTPLASPFDVGGFKLLSKNVGLTPKAISTAEDRNYAIQIDSGGRGMVNVPWADTTKLTITTKGTTGPAELIGTTLNIPEYTTSAGTVSSITVNTTPGVEYVSISNLTQARGDINLGFVGLTATQYPTVPDPGQIDCRFLIKDNYWATLWPASLNFLGGIALSSDQVQTVAPNPTTIAASRTYSVQLDANNKAVVNVPWTGGSSGITVKNQDVAFALKTGIINFKDNDFGRITASTSDQGTNVDVTTIPYSGFSPLPIYQNNSQTAGTQFISIGYYVVQDLLNVNQVAFTGSNSSPDLLPSVSVAIYQVDDSLGITEANPSAAGKGPVAVFDYAESGQLVDGIRLRVASYDALKSGAAGTTYQGRPGDKVIVCMSGQNINVDSYASATKQNPNYFRYTNEVYTNFQTVEGIEIRPLTFANLMKNAPSLTGEGLSMPGMQFYFGFTPAAASK